MKKIIALTLTIAILLSMAFSVYADDTILYSGSCGTNLTYTINSNGKLIIDGSGATDNYAVGSSLPPWYSQRDMIKTIQIESNVTSIDAYAFSGLTSLETIYWNATNCEINEGLYEGHIFAFDVETDELSVIFGVGVEKIPSEIFADCTKLKNVIVSNTVTEIGSNAFGNCVGLTNISIPESVTTIGNSAFVGCTSLTNITIPNTVTSMGKRVFEDCENLSSVSLGNGLTCVDKWSFQNCDSLVKIIIPDNVESIEAEAFYGCNSLKSVIIGAAVDSIGRRAFYNGSKSINNVYFKGSRSKQLNLFSYHVAGDNASSAEIIYSYVPATHIELNKTAIELHPGNTTQLTATITPSNATYNYVVWNSSNTDIATVTADGFLEILNEGNVTITATSVDGFLSNTCKIEVTPKLTPTCNAPTSATATYGQSLSDIILDNPSDNTDGLWSWNSPEELVGDVGSRTFKATFTPTDTDNYIAVENIDVAVTVEPKNISVQIDDIDDKNYSNEQIKPSVVVSGDNNTLVLNTDYVVDYGENIYAGLGSVTVKSKLGSNYTFTDETKDFNIVAIEQSPIITETASLTRDGHTLDLNTLVTNAKGDVSFAISGEANGGTIDNGILTSGVNQGTIKITVSITAKDINGDTINEYNAYTETDAITVTINDKATQAALNITNETTVTCGQTLNLTSEGGSGDGVTTYTVTNGTGEATIDGNTLTAVKGGTVTVVATKAEDTTYNSISSSPVTINIEKIKISAPLADETVYTYNGTEQTYNLAENSAYTISGNKQTNADETGYTVSVSINNTDTHSWEDGTIDAKNYTFIIKKANISITAKNKSIYKGSTVPTLTANDYTVSGLANGESLKTAPTIEYSSTPNSNTEGTVEIKVYGAEAPEGGNYNDISYTNGTLTITKKPSNGGGGGGGAVPTSYTIKFESNGGSEVNAITINKNAMATEPTTPVKDGFKFDGWYIDKELTTVYDFTTKVTKNFTLYAKWAEIEKEPELDETEITFTDVKKTDWFYEYIKYVIDNKLMNGVSNDNFAPNDTLTRAMLVTVLYRNAGEPATNKSIPFADVDMGAYYAKAVSWAKQNGIVTGINEKEFAPNVNITREQIATIIYRYAKYKGFDAGVGENTNIFSYSDFDDISEYAIPSMQYACSSGLMVGKTNSTLNPKDNATRAEIAAILKRFIEIHT